MRQKIRVKTSVGKDQRGEGILSDIRSLLSINSFARVETANVYRFEGINKSEAKILAEQLLSESINQKYTLNEFIINGTSHVLEIAYKPGVMNPEVASIIKSATDLGIHPTHVTTSKEYGFYGNFTKEDLEQIIKRLNLFNPIVEHIVDSDDPVIKIPIQIMTDEELLLLSKDKLFLNLEEMKIIQKYFKKLKRNPTDCELETIAQTWSEHCVHKTFKASLTIYGKDLPAGRQEKAPLIERIKKEALKHDTHMVSAFIDNSGVMDFYEDLSICGKVETHNSPSAIEPYGGAMTGSGGVFRDVVGTGLGAKTIASTDIFCFAHPSLDSSLLPLGCLRPDYLLKRVVAGVRDYGNRIGIPTNNGSIHFHNDFRAKPTVIVGAYGILPKKYAQKGKAKIGDLVVVLGGRTGRDGIHGATLASGEMTDRTIQVNASAVQIGNAIEEKRTFDAILEARDKNIIHAIQDCGAGGFSSAIGEMGEQTGVTINLEKAPLKYEGLYPWEIWVSESQERMVLAVAKSKLKELLQICKKYNVEVCVLGKFDGKKKLTVLYDEDIVCNLDMKFLHHGLPQRHMIGKKPTSLEALEIEPKQPTSNTAWNSLLAKIVSHGNICSKESIGRLYDHSVQGTNDLQPYSGEYNDGPNDAVILRPLLDKPYGVVISHGLNPILNRIDPYFGSIWTCTEAISNYVAVGGNYKTASLINNYIWPFPDEESLWSLDRSVDAVCDFMKTLKIPVISGKDSLSSTYRGKDGSVIKIPPVLCISVFGKIENASKTITSDFKKQDSVICFVGKMDKNSLGGSIYYDVYTILGDSVPKVDLEILPIVLNAIYNGIQKGKILSCHDVSEGGLLTSIFEMCVGGNCGAEIHLGGVVPQHDHFLFNETAGCFVVEVENEDIAKELFSNVPFIVLGKTQQDKTIKVMQDNATLFVADIDRLKKTWKDPMQKMFPTNI